MIMKFSIEQLSDLEEIKQLKHRYFRCIDTANEAELATLFIEDVTIDLRGGAYRAQLKGRQNMVDFIGSAFNSDVVPSIMATAPKSPSPGRTARRAAGIWKTASSIRFAPKTRSAPPFTATAMCARQKAGKSRTANMTASMKSSAPSRRRKS
jgi:hypothetical protein